MQSPIPKLTQEERIEAIRIIAKKIKRGKHYDYYLNIVYVYLNNNIDPSIEYSHWEYYTSHGKRRISLTTIEIAFLICLLMGVRYSQLKKMNYKEQVTYI